MDRATAMSRLPEPYAAALRLHDMGDDDRIAERLGIEPAGVPALLRLATAKLKRLVQSDGHTE
jgi:DNA-directed RNA polymerase specialized sigma24 family protein